MSFGFRLYNPSPLGAPPGVLLKMLIRQSLTGSFETHKKLSSHPLTHNHHAPSVAPVIPDPVGQSLGAQVEGLRRRALRRNLRRVMTLPPQNVSLSKLL
jgi:hypothetical protein